MSKDTEIILPPGSPRIGTERGVERKQENKDYLPVIIKRNDEVVRHPDDTLEYAISEGLDQLQRPFTSLFISSITAGLILGFAAMLVAFAVELTPVDASSYLKRLIMAAFYPLGFIVCIMSGAELFTEHTATAVYPVLDKKARWPSILKLWLTVISGNFIGTFLCSLLLAATNDVINIQNGYRIIAEHLIHPAPQSIFLSAVLAGWLMAQGSWLVLSTNTGISQIVCVFIATFIIGIGGFHHSIAGSAELFTAMLMEPSITSLMVIKCLFFAVAGNLVGGSTFVAVLNYAHIRKYWQD